MKIMHVLKKYPHAMGGDAVVVANLQKQQEAQGHHITIVTSNCAEIMNGAHIYKCGLKDTPSGLDAITPKRLVSLMLLFFRMFGIIRKERPDIIHTHSVDMAFFASFAARFFKVPLIHTFHIVTFYDSSQSFIRRKSELWLAKYSNFRCITAPNNFDVKKLQNAGFRQTTLMSNGVDVRFWQNTKQAQKKQNFTFLTIGRIEEQKGYTYLMQAAALLAKKQAQTFRIIIVGEGSQKASLQELAKTLGVSQIVHFVGKKTMHEIRDLLAKINAAVFPSLYETTPVTMLEAWAAEVPVIATSVGILRDMPMELGAAYIVPPKDYQSLMRAMQQCMSCEVSRGRVAAKGKVEAQKYSWPIIAKTAETVYGSI